MEMVFTWQAGGDSLPSKAIFLWIEISGTGTGTGHVDPWGDVQVGAISRTGTSTVKRRRNGCECVSLPDCLLLRMREEGQSEGRWMGQSPNAFPKAAGKGHPARGVHEV